MEETDWISNHAGWEPRLDDAEDTINAAADSTNYFQFIPSVDTYSNPHGYDWSYIAGDPCGRIDWSGVDANILVVVDNSWNEGGIAAKSVLCPGSHYTRGFLILQGPAERDWNTGTTEDDSMTDLQGVYTHELMHITGAFYNGPNGAHWLDPDLYSSGALATNCKLSAPLTDFLTMCADWFYGMGVPDHRYSWRARSLEHDDKMEFNEAY